MKSAALNDQITKVLAEQDLGETIKFITDYEIRKNQLNLNPLIHSSFLESKFIKKEQSQFLKKKTTNKLIEASNSEPVIIKPKKSNKDGFKKQVIESRLVEKSTIHEKFLEEDNQQKIQQESNKSSKVQKIKLEPVSQKIVPSNTKKSLKYNNEVSLNNESSKKNFNNQKYIQQNNIKPIKPTFKAYIDNASMKELNYNYQTQKVHSKTQRESQKKQEIGKYSYGPKKQLQYQQTSKKTTKLREQESPIKTNKYLKLLQEEFQKNQQLLKPKISMPKIKIQKKQIQNLKKTTFPIQKLFQQPKIIDFTQYKSTTTPKNAYNQYKKLFQNHGQLSQNKIISKTQVKQDYPPPFISTSKFTIGKKLDYQTQQYHIGRFSQRQNNFQTSFQFQSPPRPLTPPFKENTSEKKVSKQKYDRVHITQQIKKKQNVKQQKSKKKKYDRSSQIYQYRISTQMQQQIQPEESEIKHIYKKDRQTKNKQQEYFTQSFQQKLGILIQSNTVKNIFLDLSNLNEEDWQQDDEQLPQHLRQSKQELKKKLQMSDQDEDQYSYQEEVESQFSHRNFHNPKKQKY